jgi:4-alpha-glucanotransferase
LNTSIRPRASGLLLHPTSLPGPYGIGDLGPAARHWVDDLARARQTWWQMLPLAPAGAGNSPYHAYSAFAGSPLLVSPDDLRADGLVDKADLAADFPAGLVDFDRAAAFKDRLLARAWENFNRGSAPALRELFQEYRSAQSAWLEDYALFMALRKAHPNVSWIDWPRPLVMRAPDAVNQARRNLSDAVGRHQFAQFLFARQLAALRAHARGRGVKLIGDLPIFVSPDSADVWANPHLFRLDARRRPTVVAGVPPDYFSRTGQRWGNPHYDWPAMRRDGFAWWKARMRAMLTQADLVRIDHFRGFEAAWEIPADEPTAVRGRWVPGPGAELFEALRADLGGLPVIAEDLGEITPAVDGLRERFGLPGMRILQFAFGGAVEERFLPHTYDRNCVAYTGTHDNDTTRGWYESLEPAEKAALHRYAPEAAADPVWAMIRLAWASVADRAVAPVQDVLDLGTGARMNRPGTAEGNWGWRLEPGRLTPEHLDRLAGLTATYGRGSHAGPKDGE